MNTTTNAKLLAIVSVEHEDRVQCGQPGCGHSIYRAIHVVRDNGSLVVLGSTCFAKRYGNAATLGTARFGAGDGGRTLTAEERVLLVDNTAELLARFEAEELAQAKALADAKPEHAIAQAHQLSRPKVDTPPVLRTNWADMPAYSASSPTPWNWMKSLTSMAYFKLHDGTGWVRVQHRDGRQMLVPWPVFDGWDEAFPPSIGVVDSDCGGYVLPADVRASISYLRNRAEREKVTGIWKEIVAAGK
jgi:hypothetical protein